MSADDVAGSSQRRLPGHATLKIHSANGEAPDHRLLTVGTDTGACEAVVFDREDCSESDAKAVVETVARELGVPVEEFRESR